MHSPSSTARPAASHHERGIALFVVIVFVMLSMLLALWASRTAIFNEMVVGNDADYQRAFEAAQSLIQDAELDIQLTSTAGHRASKAELPLETSEIGDILNSLNVFPFCKDGLCVKRRGNQDFWNNATDVDEDAADNFATSLAQLATADVGARYGEFTGAAFEDDSDEDAPRNAILADRSAATRGGWYWIEVLKYADSSGGSSLIVGDDPAAQPPDLLDLKLNPSVVYRITALAYGLKPNSMAVIQETYARTRLQD